MRAKETHCRTNIIHIHFIIYIAISPSVLLRHMCIMIIVFSIIHPHFFQLFIRFFFFFFQFFDNVKQVC